MILYMKELRTKPHMSQVASKYQLLPSPCLNCAEPQTQLDNLAAKPGGAVLGAEDTSAGVCL